MGAGELYYLYLVVGAITLFGVTLAWANWFTDRKPLRSRE
jgi:hypothetical protein